MNDNDNDNSELKIHFLPGSLDNFDGTQEDLDQLIDEIKHIVQTEQGTTIDLDDIELTDPELYDQLTHSMDRVNKSVSLIDPKKIN